MWFWRSWRIFSFVHFVQPFIKLRKKYKMQRVQEEESHVGYIPPPPYTLVDQQYPGNNNNNNNNSNNNNPTLQQYHSQNPYPATVIPPDADFRLAQKLQDEEYARWAETNPQQEYYSTRAGETSASTHLPRAPMPPIPEHYQYNHYQSYQNDPTFQHPSQSQQYPIIYASPNQPPLPYTTSPYVNNGGNGGIGYGSLNQGYYTSSQSHPFYNAPYHNYQQITQREEEDSSSCLSGLRDFFPD
ncbi:hypothetical protein C1645_734627 [Glomus cerebriforme]|uniref:Uncharacterized protein n=1 Tax=Glomus cerebriforme TaxID=658196 RepID=A0A397T8T2_9GLOM|nr:hypothetical protein C1645_734627 [Glomus cerebriforme]